MNGVIKRIVADKGFGFIRDERSGIEYFFHRSALKNSDFDSITVGQEVTFEDVEGVGGKGPRAEDVFV